MPVNLAKSFGALAIAAGVLGTTAVAAIAADPPKEMKLYVFTSGALNARQVNHSERRAAARSRFRSDFT